MRVMVRVRIPVEAGNEGIRSGKLPQTVQGFVEQFKPEAAYFYSEGGERASIMVIEMDRASQIPAVAEPIFMGLNANVDLIPVMTLEDLQTGLGDVEAIIKRLG